VLRYSILPYSTFLIAVGSLIVTKHIMAAKAPKVQHTAGIFSDMTVDGPEIGTLVVIVDRARNLPNRKKIGKQDPYCAARLGKEAKKTEVDKRGGQTPKWYAPRSWASSALS
jgi:C2 domain